MTEPLVQYRIARSKKDVTVIGPDDAPLVITVDAADCRLDPTVAFMLGKLKSTGPTGLLFDELRSGRARAVLASAVPA
jgi:hypothetical protein